MQRPDPSVTKREIDAAVKAGVQYDDIQFSQPFDQEVQALAKEFAGRYNRNIADFLNVGFQIGEQLPTVLESLLQVGGPTASIIGFDLAQNLDRWTVLFLKAEKIEGMEKLVQFQADREEYETRLGAILRKYTPSANAGNADAIDAEFSVVNEATPGNVGLASTVVES
jgi:hypothetical protein